MEHRNPLVEGGTHKGFSTHPTTFLTHTFPTIHSNTIVVAAAHPSVQTGNPTIDGWFLSDFYAFNYLLHGSVADQTWLTAAAPERLVEEYNEFLHGSPNEDRKVVLSRDLLKSDITPVTVVRSAKMNNASLRAKRSGCPLLLMVFCHGIEGHYLCLDNGNRRKGISIVRLKEFLEPGVSVTLFTTACYSGGWAVSPEFNATTIAAAKADEKSISWQVLGSIGRACGSVFAGETILALSDVSTPLLAQDSCSEEPHDTSLQPEEPTEAQTETYNEFCRSITDVLEAQGTSRLLCSGFTFSAQDNKWENSWTGRSGIPLAHFKERWERLPTYLHQRSADDDGPSHIHCTAGGDAHSVVNEMTRAMLHSRVASMARLFFEELCPGDWNQGPNVAVAGQIFTFLHNNPNDAETPSAAEIADIICFRWDTCLLVDRFVDDHGLNRPDGKICVMWHCQEYLFAMQEKYGKEWTAQYGLVREALWKGGAIIEPADHQGPRFPRPLSYIASAIVETCKTEEKTRRMVQEYCEYVARFRKLYLDRAVESASVRSRGRDWLRSIGRRIRRSLSPSKRLRLSLAASPIISETDAAPSSGKNLEKAPPLYH